MMRDKDTKLLQEALGDVFKQAAKDGNFGKFAGPGEKQEKCKPGYFWCPEDKECKPDKKVDEAITDDPWGDTPDRFAKQPDHGGQQRESLSMLTNVQEFLSSDRVDADSAAIVHKAIQTMYMRIANHVESDEVGDGRDDDYRGEDPSPRETDQEKYGYPGDR